MVDDNFANLRITAQLLESLGVEVTTASSGRAALDCTEARAFDLIFMDCHMPELDGFETTQAMRGHSKAARVPIVALTAGSADVDRERCIASGMDDYLSKPFRVEDVRKKLDKWL